MSDFDVRLIEYLNYHGTSELEEISDDLNHSKDRIRSRIETLEKFGLCHAGNVISLRISDEEFQAQKNHIQRLSNGTVTWEPEERIDWIDNEDLDVLDDLKGVTQPTTIHALKNRHSSLERSEVLLKLSQMGLVEQTSAGEFKISKKGIQASNYETGPFEATKPIIPRHLKLIHYFADRTLAFLDRFDPATEDTIRDIEQASWQTERVFHEQIQSRYPLYTLTFALGIFLTLSTIGRFLSIGLQPVGLVFDIFGAVFVALGLFRGRRGIAVESEELGGRWAGSPKSLQPESVRATVTSTLDGVFGTFLLVLGFLLQLISIG